jgi:xylulokinase
VPPSSDGLVVLPYFAGERTPLQDARARGLISGLTLSHGRGHLYRAMLEATACGVRHIFEAMGEAGGGGERLVAVGSGTKGGLWTQIVSDVTGRPQDLPEQTIGASYGDAHRASRRKETGLEMRVWQPPERSCNAHCLTRNEQVSDSSSLVGSL